MMILKKYFIQIMMMTLSLLILSACTSPPAPADTGITGQAVVGPTCPVVQAGQPCPEQPYQAMITVLDSSGREVTTFQTDTDGRLKINLAAGTYTLRPQSPQGMPLPMASDQEVIVIDGQFTDVLIQYDSGIR